MKKFNLLTGGIYFYVILPVIIFLLGWTKWYIGVPGAVILIVCWYRMSCDMKLIKLPNWNREQIEIILFVLLIICLWVYFSGIGRFVFQNTDHECRNPIFEILVNYSWPPAKTVLTESGSEMKVLVYYIGFWLPSALVGKVLGLEAGYCFQAIWAVIGIFIFYLLLSDILKQFKIWPLIAFIFFSGLDIVGMFLVEGTLNEITFTTHLEWWARAFQFSSITTQLFWVFNQSIPIWILFLVLYQQKKNRYMIMLLGSVLISSTLPFIGILPFVVYWILSRKYDNLYSKNKWENWIRDIFSFENIIGGGIAGILTYIYLKGNESGQIVSGYVSNPGIRGYIFLYIIFILIEVGIYYIIIYENEKRQPLYYISLICLCACPLIRIGYSADFGMRASIPALIMLYLMIVNSLNTFWKQKKKGYFGALVIVLLLGSITPLCEINRTINKTAQSYFMQQPVYSGNQSEEEIFLSPNFSGKTEKNFFLKY